MRARACLRVLKVFFALCVSTLCAINLENIYERASVWCKPRFDNEKSRVKWEMGVRTSFLLGSTTYTPTYRHQTGDGVSVSVCVRARTLGMNELPEKLSLAARAHSRRRICRGTRMHKPDWPARPGLALCCESLVRECEWSHVCVFVYVIV